MNTVIKPAPKEEILSALARIASERTGGAYMEISRTLWLLRTRYGCTDAELRQWLKKPRPWITQHLELQRLAPELQEKLATRGKKGRYAKSDPAQISFQEAVIISRYTEDKQRALYPLLIDIPSNERVLFLRRSRTAASGSREAYASTVSVHNPLERKIFRITSAFDTTVQPLLEDITRMPDREFRKHFHALTEAKRIWFRKALVECKESLAALEQAVKFASSDT